MLSCMPAAHRFRHCFCCFCVYHSYGCNISSKTRDHRYHTMAGLVAGQFGAKFLKVIDERISPRNMLLVGGAGGV
jgi:hypothetical protein